MLSFPKIHKLGHLAFWGLIVLLPLSFFCYQAWFNSRIQFLVPSSKSEWILHSPDVIFPDKLSGTVRFRRRFELTAVPSQAALEVRAASRFRMSVNGREIEPDSQSPPKNWKFARTYDIAPYLVISDNIIEIHVTNTQGPPALMVYASLAGKGPNINSDDQWESAPEPDFLKWRRCRLTYQEPPVLGGERSPIQESSAYFIYLALLSAYALFIIAAAKPWQLLSRPRAAVSNSDDIASYNRHVEVSGRYVQWIRTAIVATAILAVLSINFHNVASYPYSRSVFDYEAHVDYVKYVASKWRIPVATQGWEMYHPPLYYFVAAIVYRLMGGEKAEPASLKAVQGLGMLSGLACLLFTWLILRICAKGNNSIQLLGWSTAAFLPMVLYVNPIISNEVFSAFLISFSLYLLMRFGFKDQMSIKQTILLGVIFGLALLSKYTAFPFFLLALFIFLLRLWIHSEHRRREAAMLLLFVVVVCAVCGWFFARNAALFHKPFMTNMDEQSGFHVEQLQGYRTLGYYFRFGSVFTRAPERSRWYSFWDGYYGSMWMDTHFNMIDYRDNQASSYGTIIFGLALLPSAAILMGWIRSLRDICISRLFKPDLALVAAVPLILLFLAWYALQIPFITTVKAFYTISLVPAFAVFSGIGLHEMSGNLRKLSPALYVSLIGFFALISYLFWYRPF